MRRSIALAFSVALTVRIALGLAVPVVPTWDGVFYERAASQMARGEGYTARMLGGGRPAHETAFYPVGWPAALSLWRGIGIERVFDPLLQAILGALLVPVAALTAFRFAGPRPARAAAWTIALWPSGILATVTWMGEPLFTLLVACAFAPLLDRRRPLVSIAASSLVFALASYVRPTALAIAPLAIAIYASSVWIARRNATGSISLPRPSWTFRAQALAVAGGAAALSIAIALAVLSPWMRRNDEHIGEPFIASNSNANLLVGTITARFVPLRPAEDCPRMREAARDRCRRDLALRRIASDPLAWLALAPVKLAHTFAYDGSFAVQLGAGLRVREPLRDPRVLALAAFTTAHWLALLGFAIASRRRGNARALLWSPFAALAAVHVLYLGGDRYHVPLVPLAAVLASPAIAIAIERIERRLSRDRLQERALNSRGASPLDRRSEPREPSA
jgi:hypothetical protein